VERVREVFRKTGSVDEALKVRGILTPHEILRICAEERLKGMGYRIVEDRDEEPEFIKRAGSPDIVAEKDGSWVVVEVKPLDQLERYKQAGVKLILVTSVRRGEDVEVWGIEDLESGRENC
jgi:hypothetical protein